MSAWQPCLLSMGAPDIDPTWAGLRRVDLGHGAWIEYVPRWLAGADRVFEALRDGTCWHTERRQMYDSIVEVPRLMASLPADGPGHPIVTRMGAALTRRYRARLDRVSLALYRDGRDSVAMHGDRVMRDLPADSLVATVSLGQPRRFLMRANHGDGALDLSLGWGDLLVMGGSCQRTWRHGVPKVAHAGPRIALMFRSGALTDR